MENLRADLETSKLSRADAQSFLQEEFLTNDKGLSIRKSFFSLVRTVQGMHQDLLRNEEMLNQQKEELCTMKEVRRKVSKYQKQKQADQIKRFSLMELKRFQVILSSRENLVDEGGGIISDAKKECNRIWELESALIEEAGLPQIEKLKTISSENSWMEAIEATHRAKRENMQQIKYLRWENIKTMLVDKTCLQTRIESWSARAEISVRKKIMKSVCQSNLTLEGYKAEILVPLTEAHDQWEAFFK